MGWGVFGRFREVTTDPSMGTFVPIWVSGLTSLKAIRVLHDSTHPLAPPADDDTAAIVAAASAACA